MPEIDTTPTADGCAHVQKRQLPSLKTGDDTGSVNAGGVLGRIGSLEVRLAANETELAQSQHLRHAIFFEADAMLTGDKYEHLASESKRDCDLFDTHCDHLLVIDKEAQPHPRFGQIVGSYRLLTRAAASNAGGFYSDGEYKVSNWVAERPMLNFLEFGRSCVLPPYRNKRTIELLWHGSWAYVLRHNIDVMFGCASFDTMDPKTIAEPLSYLFHYARADEQWDVQPVQSVGQAMNLIDINELDIRSALRQMPALIKGYLRLGAKVSNTAVIDPKFQTTDVLIIMPVESLNPRYVSHYGANAERYRV